MIVKNVKLVLLIERKTLTEILIVIIKIKSKEVEEDGLKSRI